MSRKQEFCIWCYVCVVKPDTNENVTIRGIEYIRPCDHHNPEHLQHSAHEHWQRKCAILLFVNQFRVVMIHTLHRMLQWWVLHSFLLRLLVHLFSFALLPLVLRAVASLCIPPKRVWILLTIPTSSHVWTDFEPGKYWIDDFPVSKKLIHVVRHGSPLRDNDGAIEFCRAKDNLHDHKKFCHHCFDKKWKSAMEEEDTKKDFCIVLIHEEQSRTSEFFKVIQDAILLISFITRQCLYMCHVGCVFNLRSIIISGLIPWGQSLNKRQTVFFLLMDPMDKIHKEFDTIDLNAPRFAQSMHKAWKKQQNTIYWVDISLALRKGLKCYQTRSNALFFHAKLFQLIVFRKLLGWTLVKLNTRKCLGHFGFFPRSLWNMIGRENWVQ